MSKSTNVIFYISYFRYGMNCTNVCNRHIDRQTQVTPLLKKIVLDASDPSNHMQIFNLNTITEVLDRLLLARLITHVSADLCRQQSAYRRHRSTETVLLRISNAFFRGWRRPEGHCSSRFRSVGCIRHDWPLGSPSTAKSHFRNQRLGP